MIQSKTLIWLFLIPMISAVIVYISGRISAKKDTPGPNNAAWLCVAAIILTAIPFGVAMNSVLTKGALALTVGKVTLQFDGISGIMTLTALLLGLAVVLFSADYMSNDPGQEKFYALIMILLTSIIGLSTSTDLFNIYIWFELMAVSTYSLVAFYRDRVTSLEAGIKYLVQSASGSALIILGVAITFGTTGEISMASIPALIATSKSAAIAAGACFIIGYGIKCAFVPLHFWLPDAHSQAPSGISALLSGIVIETGLVALLRTLSALSPFATAFGNVFLIFGVFNMVIGNLGALRQKEIKRMFAFSSISHMGYIALGIGFTLTFGKSSVLASEGVFFHIFTHATMKGLAFLAAGAIVYNLKLAKGDHSPLMVDDLNGLSQRYPFYALLFSVAVLALGGLPPLSGFMSKWQIFAGGAASKNLWAILLVVFAGINSVLSLGYYAPLVNRIYRHQPSESAEAGLPGIPAAMSLSLIILAVFVISLGLAPAILSHITNSAANALYAMFF